MVLSIHKRWEIIFISRHRLGPKLSLQRIARELSIDKKTVQHWLDVYDSTNDVIEEEHSGRHRITAPSADKKLLKFAEEHSQSTSSTISQTLKRKNIEVSPRTVRRRLNEAGLLNLPPRFGPSLNDDLRTARLEWAKSNQKTNWKRVIFTDETTFQLHRKVRRVWRRRGEIKRFGTVKHPLKTNVWGCVSFTGFGRISIFSPNLDAPLLCSIYKKSLLPTASAAFGASVKWTLQEDNDPKHRSRLAKRWRNDNGIVRMEWPSQT